jgi:hypothetical protein
MHGTEAGSSLAERVRELETRLQRLEAQRAIAHVMYRYIYACDELKDADRISSLFSEDAVWEGQGHFAEFGKTVGRAAIREMFVENPQVLPFTAHFLTNPVIGMSQSGRRAWGQWHTLEAATLRDHRAQVWIAAWYDNDFELVDGDWLISHIRYRDRFVATYEDGWKNVRYVSPLTLTKTSEV